ncbi:hypothetical protein MKX07_008280 [Trichoderma sp. CBMAI-0711]|uniref:Uncharacterized protein n=1 Tax=Trichoderma parareesei TaxID=858221 RepID=A0A2H2ZQ66_TRIPA|nr:hypothetical protein MKX07_008280 [Trichoderma sp. CBMAI-0711]OTA05310.1 hypothetical protein A9Z42_0059870 [Trichoderma parareesei]
MSLIGHQGGLSIGKAERPGPSLGNKVNKDSKSKSEKPSSSYSSSALEQRGLRQMIGGILHSQRRDEAQARAASLDFESSETASLSSVATEKRALLAATTAAAKKDKSRSYSKAEPKLPNPNEALMPRNRFWS